MKYKLKFKAHDTKDISQILADFFDKNGYQPDKEVIQRAGIFKNMIKYVNRDGKHSMYVSRPDKLVIKHLALTAERGMFIGFSNEELKFFDSLGFQIPEAISIVTEQKITDWWTNR